jgi:hypothetical protein
MSIRQIVRMKGGNIISISTFGRLLISECLLFLMCLQLFYWEINGLNLAVSFVVNNQLISQSTVNQNALVGVVDVLANVSEEKG